MDYTTKITILGHEFHDDDWSMVLWHYYRICCTTITSFIVETLHSMWTIEFAAIIRDAPTALHAIDFFVGFTLIYGCILVVLWIAGVFLRFILGLFGSIAPTKDTTENKDATKSKDLPETKDSTKAKDPIHDEIKDLTPSSSTTATPPLLVPEPTDPHDVIIKQLRDIQLSLKELESSFAEESLTSSVNSTIANSTIANSTTDDSTTDDSTTDDSASNEEQNENYERIERDLAKAQKAKAKANARKWGDRQRRR